MHKCTECLYTTDRQYNLNRHINKNHSNENIENKCDKCCKLYKTRSGLSKHIKTCKGITNPLECDICHNIYSSRSGLSHHKKICKEKVNQIVQIPQENTVSITNNNNIETQIQTNNNINTQNNTNNITINLLKFPANNYEDDFDFLTDHIDKKLYTRLIDHYKPIDGLINFSKEVLKRPENAIVQKKNIHTKYSDIHIGDGNWEVKQDKNVYPMLAFQMSRAAFQCTEEYKNKVKLLRTNIAKILDYVEYINNVDVDNDEDCKDQKYKTFIDEMICIVHNFTRNCCKI